MPYTERSKPQVILNKMTRAVYDSIEKDPDQLYAVTDAEVYSLPTASANTLGGIKVGNNLSIADDGTLSAEAGGDAVYDANGVSIIDTPGSRVKIGNGATTYNGGVAIGNTAKAGSASVRQRAIAIGNEASANHTDSIAIGASSIGSGQEGVAIGLSSEAAGRAGVSIGKNSYAFGADSVALGSKSYAEEADTVSVGDPGYEPDGVPAYYRKITCVEDGTDAHDAATVGQMPKERELTQAEYNALTEDEKNNGTTYYVTDSNPILAAYPVGSIYMSVTSANPSTLFGGSWEQIKDRFLLAAGDSYTAGTTGGEASHTLTIDEMPSHTHDVRVVGDSNGGGSTASNYQIQIGSYSSKPRLATMETGGSLAHNNMPPYLTVYIWRRIA